MECRLLWMGGAGTASTPLSMQPPHMNARDWPVCRFRRSAKQGLHTQRKSETASRAESCEEHLARVRFQPLS